MKLGKLVNLSEPEVNDLLTILDVFVPVLSLPTEWVEGWDQVRTVAQTIWVFVSSEQAKVFYRQVGAAIWTVCLVAIAMGYLAREVFEGRKAIKSAFVARVKKVRVDISSWRDLAWCIACLKVLRWEMIGKMVLQGQILSPVNLRVNRIKAALIVLRG